MQMQHFQNFLHNKVFDVSKYTFVIRDLENTVVAVRKQLPLKLGYAVTVDKSQGRTLDAVVVDSTNFWRPGQLGVAVGRATSKNAIQLTAYNKWAANIRHPKIVHDYYSKRSLLMKEDLSCCNKRNVDEPYQLVSVNVTMSGACCEVDGNPSEYLDSIEVTNFPYDIADYVRDLIKSMPKVTHIQHEQIQILEDAKGTSNFINFLSKAFTVVSDLFNKYKISEKKTKCNWCRLCAHLHTIFRSTSYRSDVITAFNRKTLHANENSICTRIYFNLLECIAKKEADKCKQSKLKAYQEAQALGINLDALDRSSLRYIAGASIHHVREKLEHLAMSQLMDGNYKAKLNHRKHQLTSKLIGPPHVIQSKSCDPDSLLKVIDKDFGGLLYVTDDTFEFFKVLLLKTKQTQNILSVQMHPDNFFPYYCITTFYRC